ncbi:hypothetical protein [Marinomonas sp. 2405UD68-3]|uniref:hypothetical protein n=1 Tax=Marinomonas sp. 2405UD68-3 TaxID=3391835 RepID=UPI0039C9B13A
MEKVSVAVLRVASIISELENRVSRKVTQAEILEEVQRSNDGLKACSLSTIIRARAYLNKQQGAVITSDTELMAEIGSDVVKIFMSKIGVGAAAAYGQKQLERFNKELISGIEILADRDRTNDEKDFALFRLIERIKQESLKD